MSCIIFHSICPLYVWTHGGTQTKQDYLQDRPLEKVLVPQVPSCAEGRGTAFLRPLALPELCRYHPGAGQRKVSSGAELELVKLESIIIMILYTCMFPEE